MSEIRKFTKQDMLDMANFLKSEVDVIENNMDMMFEAGEIDQDFDFVEANAVSKGMFDCAILLKVLGGEFSE
jgi:uncharacterized protein YqeY